MSTRITDEDGCYFFIGDVEARRFWSLDRWKSYLRRLWCTCFLAAHFSLARIRVNPNRNIPVHRYGRSSSVQLPIELDGKSRQEYTRHVLLWAAPRASGFGFEQETYMEPDVRPRKICPNVWPISWGALSAFERSLCTKDFHVGIELWNMFGRYHHSSKPEASENR